MFIFGDVELVRRVERIQIVVVDVSPRIDSRLVDWDIGSGHVPSSSVVVRGQVRPRSTPPRGRSALQRASNSGDFPTASIPSLFDEIALVGRDSLRNVDREWHAVDIDLRKAVNWSVPMIVNCFGNQQLRRSDDVHVVECADNGLIQPHIDLTVRGTWVSMNVNHGVCVVVDTVHFNKLV
jgi:hypothetical protein